jgi:hypothetical protein
MQNCTDGTVGFTSGFKFRGMHGLFRERFSSPLRRMLRGGTAVRRLP